MPREESEQLKSLERDGADAAVSDGVIDMGRSYQAYLSMVSRGVGGNALRSAEFLEDVTEDIRRRLLQAG
jgi:hypothetical protein